MASTVTPSEFKVFIKEVHVINGIRTVNENLYRIPNVTNYDRRIVTVPADTNVDLRDIKIVKKKGGTIDDT